MAGLRGGTRRDLLGLGLGVPFLGARALAEPAVRDRASDARRDDAEVFDQAAIGEMACGPCSLYNALLAGPRRHRAAAKRLEGKTHADKVRSLVREYADKPSETYGARRARYDAERGMCSADFEWFASEALDGLSLPDASGHWLNRGEDESQDDQLRRVHRTLSSSALPPVIEVRSFHADIKEPGKALWDGLFGHFLTVVEVEELPAHEPASGFLMRCADSANGRRIPAFAQIERYRPFTATRGFTVDDEGKEVWRWQQNSPYVLVSVPDLRLRTSLADWHERTIVALTWAFADEEDAGR